MVLILLMFVTNAHSSTPNTLTYDDIKNGRGDEVKRDLIEYTAYNGDTIKVGGSVRLMSPSGTGLSTVGATNTVYGSNAYGFQYFKYIYNGAMNSTVWKAMLTVDPSVLNAPGTMSQVDVTVRRVHLGGTQRKPYVWAECTVNNKRDTANLTGTITVWDVDGAIKFNEINVLGN